ncbi:hypothetical protein C8J57DRAFT_1608559 [Mycena rebaudengoi]|nr:hypothetical protein C8J57DRAFT_1608559 [Mycena rebaudengoi]
MSKRLSPFSAGTVVKRARVTPLPGSLTQIAISSSRDKSKGLTCCMIRSVQRTSGLDAGVVRTNLCHHLGLLQAFTCLSERTVSFIPDPLGVGQGGPLQRANRQSRGGARDPKLLLQPDCVDIAACSADRSVSLWAQRQLRTIVVANQGAHYWPAVVARLAPTTLARRQSLVLLLPLLLRLCFCHHYPAPQALHVPPLP